MFDKKYFRYLLWAVIAVLFLGIYSPATSPLAIYYGADSAFFIMVARGMKEGLLPYRDFFDMKGPYFFLIQYVGQLIYTGRFGAFIIQCINLFFSLIIIDNIYISEAKIKKITNYIDLFKLFLVGIFPCLFVASMTFEWGNLTEEFSLPILLLVLKFFLSYLRRIEQSSSYRHSPMCGLIYGCIFGFFALYRITNAALIGAIIFTITVILLANKEFCNLLLNGLLFIIGTVVAFVPICVFYAQKGLLKEMLYQVFLFGFQYSSEVSFSSKVISLLTNHWAVILLMFFPIICLIIFGVKDWKCWVFALISFFALILAAAMGNGYLHYFTLGIPNVVFGITVLIRETDFLRLKITQKKILIVICICLALLQMPCFVWRSGICMYKCLGLGPDKEYYNQIQEIKNYIPEDERALVYVYGLSSCSSWYETAGLFPANKYCDWQDHYMELVPEIEEELLGSLAGNEVQWLVVPIGAELSNDKMIKLIDEKFMEYALNDGYILYKKEK